MRSRQSQKVGVAEKKRRSHSSCAKLRSFKDLDEDFKESLKEKWQQELLRIEQRWSDWFPEKEKMQKMSQKLLSLQEKVLQCNGTRASWSKEMNRSGRDRKARSSNGKIQEGTLQEAEVDQEVQDLQAVQGRRGVLLRRRHLSASRWEQSRQMQQLPDLQGERSEIFEVPHLPAPATPVRVPGGQAGKELSTQ